MTSASSATASSVGLQFGVSAAEATEKSSFFREEQKASLDQLRESRLEKLY